MVKKTVKIKNGETIAYLDGGQGDKTLIAIHGNMSAGIFMKPFFERVSGYRVIAPDLRGFGDSTYNTRSCSLKDYANDIIMLMDELKIDNAAVAGWSLGGGVAMEMAVTAPERITRLVLTASTPCDGYPLFRQENGAYIPYQSPEEMGTLPVIAASYNALKEQNGAYVRYALDLTVFNNVKPPEEDYAVYCAQTLKQRNLLDVDWAIAALNLTSAPSLYNKGTNEIGKITCPVLLTYGEKDLALPMALTNRNIAAFGNKAKVIGYDAGHAVFVDCPDAFFSDLKDLLAE